MVERNNRGRGRGQINLLLFNRFFVFNQTPVNKGQNEKNSGEHQKEGFRQVVLWTNEGPSDLEDKKVDKPLAHLKCEGSPRSQGAHLAGDSLGQGVVVDGQVGHRAEMGKDDHRLDHRQHLVAEPLVRKPKEDPNPKGGSRQAEKSE